MALNQLDGCLRLGLTYHQYRSPTGPGWQNGLSIVGCFCGFCFFSFVSRGNFSVFKNVILCQQGGAAEQENDACHQVARQQTAAHGKGISRKPGRCL